jgi:hypothetical protein
MSHAVRYINFCKDRNFRRLALVRSENSLFCKQFETLLELRIPWLSVGIFNAESYGNNIWSYW